MAPETIARAFDPFFTTKPIGQGTGLSMVYGFAGQSGGTVKIYFGIDRGTMLCIHLPRYLGEEETNDQSMSPEQMPRAEGGETILLVDDEPPDANAGKMDRSSPDPAASACSTAHDLHRLGAVRRFDVRLRLRVGEKVACHRPVRITCYRCDGGHP